jgi:hypothetical protein
MQRIDYALAIFCISDMFSEDQDMMSEDLKYNCDQLRRKINAYLATGKTTQTAFLKATKTNSNSFRRFMTQKGPFSGSGNNMFIGGNLFFEHLESQPKENAISRKTQKALESDFLAKLESVPLTTNDPIFDNCDIVRTKILKLVGSDHFMTKASFAKYINVNSNSLNKFLSVKGPTRGREIGVYQKAYYFFERKRIAFGEPKSKQRVSCEKNTPNGFSTEREVTHMRVFVGDWQR